MDSKMHFLFTLKFQITLALFFLVLVLAGSMIVSQQLFDELYQTEKVLQLGSKLQKSSHQMSMQAMNYQANPPADDSGYNRDLNLYYKDLMAHIDTFDMIDNAFMANRFSSEMTGMDDMMETQLNPETRAVVEQLHHKWLDWRKQLMDKLGKEASMPRLALAAEFIENNGEVLTSASDDLIGHLERYAYDRKKELEVFNRNALIFSVVTVVVIIFWFYQRVILPLDKTSQGMKKVALGNFDQQLDTAGKDEISQMNQQFNFLSGHLHSLFQLMTRLYEGSNLDDVLQFISEEFSKLLPLDWVGVLFVIGDKRIQLEKGYSEFGAESFGSIRFELEGTLLEQSLISGQPLHIEDIEARARESDRYKFLQILISKNCHEAIFLPLVETGGLQGVLVFASRQSRSYTQEHLSLLRNLSLLITLSFKQTVKLSDYQHFAAIGRFATGIAHEIRSPLATINLALDYFRENELPETLKKRAQLASAEAERLKRLMEDILLYAKPLQIKTRVCNLQEIIQHSADLQQQAILARDLHFEFLSTAAQSEVVVDRDRIQQVILNLIQNAVQVSENGGVIMAMLTRDPHSGWINFQISNRGEPIKSDVLEKVFEPFYTTRAHGTGLGLNIAKRIIEAHGGEIRVSSDETDGTRFEIALPPVNPV